MYLLQVRHLRIVLLMRSRVTEIIAFIGRTVVAMVALEHFDAVVIVRQNKLIGELRGLRAWPIASDRYLTVQNNMTVQQLVNGTTSRWNRYWYDYKVLPTHYANSALEFIISLTH